MLTLWLVVLLAVSASFEEFSQEKLRKLSTEGQNYLNKQIENAINGAKVMKSLTDKNDKEHQKFLRNLELTDKQKKDALVAAKEAQRKLNETEKCQLRESMWEECKPCLKQTCTKFYSRVCRRGFNTVEKEVEKFFNVTPVDSVWVNGEKLDSLMEKNEELGKQFEQVERQFEDMDEFFKESTKAFEDMDSFAGSPFNGMGFFPSHFSLFPDYSFPRFGSNSFGHGMLSSLFDMTQRMFEKFHRIMHEPELNPELFPEGEGSNETSPDGKNQFICHEIRRNSAGCMKLSNKCEKCKELMSLECFDTDHKPLRRTFEESLSMAEKFAKKYDDLMFEFQEYMKNQTRELENLNTQFGWVSKLANYTKSPEGFYNIKTVISSSESSNSMSGNPETKVTVQIFDSPPLTFTVPGDSDWNDPKFSDMLAQKALDLYNKWKMEVSPTHQLETIEA
ncbi:clusterin [Hypanus sabinus]|uniref:clusterin n=1 Tax=Hypanus sabinus TaxID=79690 RepID=UPI0028C4EC67|nr:clusterin [Hypanus sabinus]XP_059837396.1 clusterin [Hypanus sabinus]XP_059837398.1 clusterin [Hypanus sabinus]